MLNPLLDLSSKDELISNLLSGSKPAATPKDTPAGERKTFKVKSDLVARLEDFLPKIKEANAQLDQQLKMDPKAVDIENVDEQSGEQYIEMDLGLGVFDLKKDVTEEDIIINPSDIKEATATTPVAKPAIVMMDTDKESLKISEEDDDKVQTKISSSEQQIPATISSNNGKDEDTIMKEPHHSH
ncbi:hypothetical protein EDD11_002606 [Mortierella claussenii]|nr:hypothetical protein EDD11_002606 [Mortierella claussenii]